MNSTKHIIIYSHGFGVRKDDVGLLTEIAASLPEVESILFDYFEVDEVNKILTMRPPSVTSQMLRDLVKKTREENPDAIIDIIAHSQGCVISAIAKPDGIRKTLLLAPVFDMSIERTLSRYRSRPGSDINLDGMSTLPVFDGFLRRIPASYWAERKNLKPFDDYNQFAEKTELIVMEANQDELIPKVDLDQLSPKAILAPLHGDHNFTGEYRKPLLEAIRKYLL